MAKLENIDIQNIINGDIINDKLNNVSTVSGIVCTILGMCGNTQVIPLTVVSYLTFFATCYLTKKFNTMYNNNEDVLMLKRIYDEVLDDIVKMSIELDNRELLEHFELLNYIYRNNYLSYNKKDNGYLQVYNEMDILKYLCLNNHGVCRHTSLMDADYLGRLGYEAVPILGVSYIDKEKLKEFYSNYLSTNYDVLKENGSFDAYVDLIKFHISSIEKPTKHELRVGNHTIVLANDFNNSHYLDITQNKIYVPNGGILGNERGTMFKELKRNSNITKGFDLIERKKTLSQEEIDLFINQAKKKIEENIDFLINFHKNNKDKLEEAEKIHKKLRIKS